MLGADKPVMLEVARILVEILTRPELGRIHKNGNDHHISAAAGDINQRRMAGMEKPHRGNQRDALPRAAGFKRKTLELLRLSKDTHLN